MFLMTLRRLEVRLLINTRQRGAGEAREEEGGGKVGGRERTGEERGGGDKERREEIRGEKMRGVR